MSGVGEHDDVVTPLTVERTAALRAAPFSYEEVGRTRAGPPDGYGWFEKSRVLSGDTDFDAAADALLRWQVQTRAGLRVAASDPVIAPDVVVVMRLGLRPVALTAPCRVVYVIDEADRQGFGYGTLPGHPERGEESFVLHRGASGPPTLVISAFSRPATVLAKLGGPMGTIVQSALTNRCLRSLDA